MESLLCHANFVFSDLIKDWYKRYFTVVRGPCLFLWVRALPEISTAQYANQRWKSELPEVTPDAR